MTGPVPLPKLILESMDGLRQIPLDGSTGWIRMPGATGLEMPPVELIADAIPGVDGSVLQDVRVQERPVFIPIYGSARSDHVGFLGMLDELRALIDPRTGTFKLVGSTARGEREMIVSYTGGLEGADGEDRAGLSWCKIGLTATAHQPYTQDRADRSLEYRVSVISEPFLGVVGGTDTPWPRSLSSSSVIGSGMQIPITSEVPVYPVLELIGPMTSFQGELSPTILNPDNMTTTIADQTWFVEIGAGVAAGSTLRMVTDPRNRSVRYNGGLGAGRVSLGSSLRPFYPGLNTLNVAAPGGTEATIIRLSWRELHRSLW